MFRAQSRREAHAAKGSGLVIPVSIFTIMLVVMYLVKQHTQLHTRQLMEHERQSDEQFVTGGRKAQMMGRRERPLIQAPPVAQSPPPFNTSALECRAEQHAEYHGPVVVWGDGFYTDSAEDCCNECKTRFKAPHACNVWAWCGAPGGCDGRKHRECWLKQGLLATVLEENVGKGNPGVAWTSGLLYTDEQMAAYKEEFHARQANEANRLAALRANESLPLVWMDVSLHGSPLGRVEIVLFRDKSPLAAENFRRMCTGETGSTLKGAFFYRIIDGFIDQSGGIGPVALGGNFRDDMGGKSLKHDRKGLLSMANMGPDTNGNHFSVLMAPAPHLNFNYAIFGEVVSNLEALIQVNQLAKGKPRNEWSNTQDAKITDCGQIRQGEPVPQEVVHEGLRN